MKIQLLTVQKIKDDGIKTLMLEYQKRLPRQWGFEVADCRGEKLLQLRGEEEQKQEGSKLFLAKAQTADYLVLLEESGKERTSTDFASHLQSLIDQGKRNITFGIGGPAGWSKEAIGRADELVSLGKLTFPYQLATLLVVEQLYRAYTIMSGIPYHK